MEKKMMILSTAFMMFLMTLASCGGKAGNETGGIDGPSGNTSEGPVKVELTQDLNFDEDGKPLFEDVVELKMWSIIGNPDQIKFRELIKKFNDEYLGMISIDVTYQGHYDYYTALDSTYKNEFESFPDICFMHNERTTEYAYKDYLYPLDSIIEDTKIEFDFTQVYENIDRVTKYKNRRYAVPVDAHGFVTSIRQDIIKKNGLGFDDNTRFIPESRAEYNTLLEGLRKKADEGQLYTRNINKGQDHSWKIVSKDKFYPSFTQSTDPDGLSALYANDGRLTNGDQTKVTFHENEGFKTYLTDQVERTNKKLIGEPGTNTESFAAGNIVMFTEGPWWVSQTYTPEWNNAELKKAEKGVSAEDANDPIYSEPYIASHPKGWWSLDPNSANASKWYGNGHAISLTKHITSLQKAAAALTFVKWYTQNTSDDGKNYDLATWCSSGHIPAWKNVYASEGYQELVKKNMTLRALGDPNDIIAMEGLEYESTIFSGLASSCSNVINQLKSSEGCTAEKAIEILNATAESTQASLDLLKMDF